ncbi:MAG: 16S rRNA (adenine(1518)-N(6)/adenine(1519)-N(6))-dimethyltransferase RsmA [Christensenellaceae bacterium]|jgi:16S rRNA (adenine1518-N6/adenine1519-N6)-dimethyltransferase|nr:16S rRNA (adenine(1518)-N(6)/adenine(1519)-N(6))-dimethyltransferase RsmA [Christensenellaceae bacterium]
MNKSVFDILKQHKFKFKKLLGQNFITDTNLLNSIALDSNATKDDTIVEIGAGAGTLTIALSEIAKAVYAFEIDPQLKPILDIMLKNRSNIKVDYRDVLRLSDKEFSTIVNSEFVVVSNLPYYITTPILMRFIESSLPVKSLTLTMQKEVAYRLTARHNTPEYGAITLAVQLFGNAKITRIINRTSFRPSPIVDSAVVNIERRNAPVDVKDIKQLRRLIHSGFAMRRKTFINNISASFCIPKETLRSGFESMNYSEMIRGEALSLDDYIRISDYLTDLKTK